MLYVYMHCYMVMCFHVMFRQALFAYVTLKTGVASSPELVTTLKQHVREHVGAFAVPDHILLTPGNTCHVMSCHVIFSCHIRTSYIICCMVYVVCCHVICHMSYVIL